MELTSLNLQNITIEGLSLAGIRTSITLPQFSLAFDVAQGLPHAIPMSTFLISHGHMDHAAGIPYIISQKTMNTHRPAIFYMPPEMIDPMKVIMDQWKKIEGHQYAFQFLPAVPGEIIPLKTSHFIRPFRTLHRVPSLGYSLCRRFRKLRSELEGKSSEEIRSLKMNGEEPTEERHEILASFTGDTQIEFLDLSPEVRKSKILIMETTYFDERKPVSSARDWGHTHFEEVLARLKMIESEKIVLIHSSARYGVSEIEEILRKRLSAEDRERVVLFRN